MQGARRVYRSDDDSPTAVDVRMRFEPLRTEHAPVGARCCFCRRPDPDLSWRSEGSRLWAHYRCAREQRV